MGSNPSRDAIGFEKLLTFSLFPVRNTSSTGMHYLNLADDIQQAVALSVPVMLHYIRFTNE